MITLIGIDKHENCSIGFAASAKSCHASGWIEFKIEFKFSAAYMDLYKTAMQNEDVFIKYKAAYYQCNKTFSGNDLTLTATEKDKV